MRLGMIIVLEEFILNNKKRIRSLYDFNETYEESNNRFVLSTRNKKRFENDLDFVHPENPQLKFTELHKKGDFSFERLVDEYKKALDRIIVAHTWYVDKDEVTHSLKAIRKHYIFN